MKVPVISAPDRGRAVFLGLLYETLIRMSTADGDSSVAVITGPVETKNLGDLRTDLLSGRWPSDERERTVSGCSLEIGFRSSSSSFFRKKELSRVRLENVLPTEKDLKVLRSAGQLREVLEGSPGGSIDHYGLSEGLRDSLESEVIILLADVPGPAGESSRADGERDAFLATLVDNSSRTRFGKDRKVAFITVLTGADRAEMDDQKVFEEALPRTAGSLASAVKRGSSSEQVISWLGTVPEANGAEVPSTVVREGQVQIDYSEKEYRRLIDIIGKLAR